MNLPAALLALALHRRLEAGHVHLDLALATDVGGEINRKAVGVVQREQRGAVERVALGDLGQRAVQDLHAVFERFAEAFFFLAQHLRHALGHLGQLGIGFAHLGHQVRHQAMEERLGLAQLVAMAQGAAHNAAQHVAAAFVAGNDAVDDEKGASADVIGDDLQGVIGQILHAGLARGGGDQLLEQVDLVVGMHVLQHRRDALQAHAGVHAGLGQAFHVAGGVALELHEHQVPDLDVAIAVFLGRARRAAPDFRTMVVEDFRTRAAGAGVRHLPEVVGRIAGALVVADPDDALGGHADFLGPDVVGLVVFLVDRDPQLLGRQLVDLGQQLPGVLDGLALEVVAEAEVAQHLEERMVAGGVAHVLEVVVLAAGAHAALRRRGALVGARFLAGEYVLELHHTRVGKEQRGVVGRHQGRRRNDRVALGLEELQELLANLRGFHRG